jgi:hypothetical protein
MLQKAVDWGTQLSEVLRKAAAAAQQQAGTANGTRSTQPAAAPAAICAIIQAACAAATELCSRLQQYVELPAVRREVSGLAPKLLQPLLSVLDNSSIPDDTQAAGLQLAAALMRCVPSSLRPLLANLERLLQQAVLRAASGAAGSSVSTAGGPQKQQMLAQAAVCAALLPAVSGEAAAWSDAAKKLMVSCHDVLDHLLMGLEGRPVDAQYRTHLGVTQQQGQAGDALGGWLKILPWLQHEQQGQAAMRRQTVPAVLLSSFCLTALQHLLQQPFAVPVPVPGYSLSLLAARLHRFDAAAAVAAGAVPGSSTMYQELLVLQPQLQLAGWQLLQQVVRVCGQQLQLQGLLLRLTRQGMRAVQLSGPAALQQQPVAVRCCMYDTAAALLLATGLAGARTLAAEGMGCVVLELYGHTAVAANGKGGAAAGQQRPAKRARKSGGAAGGDLGQFDPAAAVAAAAADDSSRLVSATAADLQAQVAALAVLKGLLAAGGQVLPAEVRAHADAVAYHISASAAQLAMQLTQQPALSAAAAGGAGELAGIQVAAYEALLASVLVPCSQRPPFLSQAVSLFRQGRSSGNGAVAAVCQSAALQVEVLLHPRATAMGVMRQYAGMDGVPPLAKPRMWDVFAPQQQQQQQQHAGHQPRTAAAVADGAPGATVSGNGMQQPQVAGADGFLSKTPAAVAAASQGNAAAGAGPVVIGYPVNSQSVVQNQHTQQQQQQQHHSLGQRQPAAASSLSPRSNADAREDMQSHAMQAPQDDPAMALDSVTSEGADPMQQRSRVVDQPQQQQQQQQDGQGVGGWAPAQQARQPPAAVASTKAPAAPVFEDESSDSEGPLPDIDSGDSSSGEEA